MISKDKKKVMTITSEEKFNQAIWWVLQEIKKEYLATSEDDYVHLNYQVSSEKIPSHEDQRRALGVLQKEGAIKIIRNVYPRPFESLGEMMEMKPIRVLLDIPNEKQFEKVYKKYQKACHLNNYLNDYQQKAFKRRRLPEFSQVKHTDIQTIPSSKLDLVPSLDDVTNRGMEEFYKDEIQLIKKLLQICNEQTKSVILMYPSHLAESDPDKAGFDRIETLKVLHKNYGVFPKFGKPLPDKLPHTLIIQADIAFSKLKFRAENLHDEVESWKGKVYGIEQQKRIILGKLQDLFRKSPQEEYIYSERILGAYTPRIESKPMGLSLLSPDPNRLDIKFQFMRAMRELERDGHIEILDVDFDFDALPQSTLESRDAKKRSLGERSLNFYSARHCHVKLRPKAVGSVIKAPSIPLPNDVEWKTSEEKWTLIFKGGRKLEFTNINKRTAKYFKLLIEHHGAEIKHKKAMELVANITKDQIENLIKALRKKIKNAELSSRIKFTTDYQGGYTLNISKK